MFLEGGQAEKRGFPSRKEPILELFLPGRCFHLIPLGPPRL